MIRDIYVANMVHCVATCYIDCHDVPRLWDLSAGPAHKPTKSTLLVCICACCMKPFLLVRWRNGYDGPMLRVGVAGCKRHAACRKVKVNAALFQLHACWSSGNGTEYEENAARICCSWKVSAPIKNRNIFRSEFDGQGGLRPIRLVASALTRVDPGTLFFKKHNGRVGVSFPIALRPHSRYVIAGG